MAIDFPSYPEVGDIYENPATGAYYQYTGTTWEVMCFGKQNCQPEGSWENQGEHTGNTVPPTGLLWRWIPPDSTDRYAPHNTCKLMLSDEAELPIDSFESDPEYIYINDTFFVIRKLDKTAGKYNSIYLHGDQRDFLNNNNTLNYKFCGGDDFVPRDDFETDQKRQDDLIVELEEEIEALAPTSERGSWTFNALGVAGNAGQFTMYDADYGNGSATGVVKDVKSIWFNAIDSAGTSHGFAGVNDGDLLQLLVEGQPDYSIFTVVGPAHDESAGGSSFWVIDVVYERSLEDTTEFSDGDICRLKILKPAAGGDTFFQMPAVLPYVLRNINSTSQVSMDGEFVYYTSFLYYRKNAAGLIIPELKKGDEFRAVLQNGKTLILEVTGQGSFSSPFYVCPTRIVSQGVTLADSENYNVNFIYY